MARGGCLMRELAGRKRVRVVALAALVVALAACVTLGATLRGGGPGATAQTTATGATPATVLPANPPTCTAKALGVSRASNPGLAADCDTLLAIQSTLRVSGWINYDTPSWWDHSHPLNWFARSPLKHWRTVTLGGTPQRVIGLDFSDTRESVKVFNARTRRWEASQPFTREWTLRGVVPTQLGNLTALEVLDLGGSELTGAVPTQLGALTKLTRLDLGDNKLTGVIPTQLEALTALTSLDLSDNKLTGAVPTQLGALTALTRLDLGDNKLTGAIPTQLGRLTALTSLALSVGNAFTGCIPGPLWMAATRDLVDLELKTCISGTIEEGRGGAIDLGESFGAGTYEVPFTDFTEISTGENKAIVFTVPAGLRIKAQGAHSGGSCMTEFCPPPGMMFEGKGETGDDKGFVFCLDFETGADCGSGYPITRRAGDTTDQYGDPPGARASRAARAAKYDSMLDQIIASSHIEDVP